MMKNNVGNVLEVGEAVIANCGEILAGESSPVEGNMKSRQMYYECLKVSNILL